MEWHTDASRYLTGSVSTLYTEIMINGYYTLPHRWCDSVSNISDLKISTQLYDMKICVHPPRYYTLIRQQAFTLSK
jgi:hypothetical protein